MTGIYKITSPTGKIYVGQSTNIIPRIRLYKNLHCKGQRKIYLSLKKYGWENHVFEILEECDVDNLIERENYWKDYYNCVENGLNCGKDGKFGYDSEETKKIKRQAKMGNQYALGHSKSISAKQKISKKMKNHPSLSKESRKIKLSNYKSIPIIQCDLEGNLIREWNSAKEAAISLRNKNNGSDIRACIRGEQKTAYGYIWKNKRV